MKNYIYGWELKSRGCIEVPEDQYTDDEMSMKHYIDKLSEVVKAAKCGWDGVRYAKMQYPDGSISKYMVLWVEGGGSRWIPITGNSKGCNLSVLGENLW